MKAIEKFFKAKYTQTNKFLDISRKQIRMLEKQVLIKFGCHFDNNYKYKVDNNGINTDSNRSQYKNILYAYPVSGGHIHVILVF